MLVNVFKKNSIIFNHKKIHKLMSGAQFLLKG